MICTIFKWANGCDESINWSDFIDGLKDGRYLIMEHTIEVDNCGSNILQKFVIERRVAFDIVKEWKQKNSQGFKRRLSCYDVHCKYDDGLLVIMDKGVLVELARIREALCIETDTTPSAFFSLSSSVCFDTVVINMTKLIEMIEKDKC